MNVLITGVTGFIGQRLLEHLSQRGYGVYGVGRRKAPSFKFPVTYLESSDYSSLKFKSFLNNIDVVVHCAGKAGTWGDYDDYFQANFVLTKQLVDSCVEAGVSRFINISSPSIYFQLKDQLDIEETFVPKKFFNAYAETKYLAEEYVQNACSESFLSMSLRPRGVIGRGDQNWFPRILDLYHAGKLIRPSGKNPMVEFTSVQNLVEFIEGTFTLEKSCFGEVYNICNNEPVYLWDFIEEGLRLLNLDVKTKGMPFGILMGAGHLMEGLAKLLGQRSEPMISPIKIGVASYSFTLNTAKIRKHTGYDPSQTSMDALSEFARWWSSR